MEYVRGIYPGEMSGSGVCSAVAFIQLFLKFSLVFGCENFPSRIMCKKPSYCWNSSRYDEIIDSGRSANFIRNTKCDSCKFLFQLSIRGILWPVMLCQSNTPIQ